MDEARRETEDLTTTRAAEMAGVSRRHINLMIRQGVLPARKEETPRGPLYYIARADLETWIQQRRPAGRPRTPEAIEAPRCDMARGGPVASLTPAIEDQQP